MHVPCNRPCPHPCRIVDRARIGSRISRGGEPFVDMGAYEFQGTSCFGDLDGDDDIDLSDLGVLLASYGMTSDANYAAGDLDGDEDVDLSDLSALLAVYGTTCP